MAINLQKGQREVIASNKFIIGLGWDANATSNGKEFDLDASVFLLNSSGKLVSDQHFIFYNNLKSPDGSVEHTGDNRTGEGDGDDESIIVDMAKLNSEVEQICIVVTIHEAEKDKLNFGQVRNSFMRIHDEASKSDIAMYELEEDFSIETAVEFGRLYKKNGEWKFQAVGEGSKEGLEFYLNKYN